MTSEWRALLEPSQRRSGRWSLRRRRATRRPAPATVVYRWDLDKTYLKSDFESLRKMMRVPFERAHDKIDEPGVVALIRALKTSARREQRAAFVYFISASPPQIGRAIREKLALETASSATASSSRTSSSISSAAAFVSCASRSASSSRSF